MNDPRIHYTVMPAQHFSGDLVVAATSPGGRLYAMLADATGHGLSAAVSVQPVLPMFYSLVAQDVSMSRLVAEINNLLNRSLPVGRFVGAAIMSIDPTGSAAEVWIGGVPAALVVGANGRVRMRVPSKQLPLGVIESTREGCEPERISLAAGEQVVLYSDGVIEAIGPDGKDFGLLRLEEALASPSRAQRIEVVKVALAEHLAGISAHDDMSLLMVDTEALGSVTQGIDPVI